MEEITLQDLIAKLGPSANGYVRKSKYLVGNQVVPYPDGLGYAVSPEVFDKFQSLMRETSVKEYRRG